MVLLSNDHHTDIKINHMFKTLLISHRDVIKQTLRTVFTTLHFLGNLQMAH
jgi:hypothetical protein